MGPFGTGILTPMIPELRDHFDSTTTALAWGFTLYLVPFAVLMTVSGSLSERWGRQRTARITFAAYGAVTLLTVLSPNLFVFCLARAVAGSLNAFFTPILLAALADITPPDRLGAAVGAYSSFQSLGALLAPLVGGLAADVDWRLAFVVVAVVSCAMATVPVPGDADRLTQLRLRPLLARPTMLLAGASFAAALGPLGVAVVVGLMARDGLGLSGSVAGMLLLAGPAGATAAGRPWGHVLDRIGGRRAGVTALLIAAGLVAVMAGARTALLLTVTWFLAGCGTNLVVVSIQSLASGVQTTHRAGVISFVLAHRFLGQAVGAVVWMPVFGVSAVAAFLGSAGVGLLAVVLVVASGLGRRAGSQHR